MDHEDMAEMIEQIIQVTAPKVYELDADKGDDCMPYAQVYDDIESILSNYGIKDDEHPEPLPSDDTLLKDIDIEGWYVSDVDDMYIEIIDPSVNEPEEGYDWATNVTVWNKVTIGDVTKLHDVDGLLKSNTKESTWKELMDMITDCTGYTVVRKCTNKEEEYLSELECE